MSGNDEEPTEKALTLTFQLGNTKTNDFASWVQSNLILRGKPFSFAGHSYLQELYTDPQPRVVIRKAAQMGGSTFALARCLFSARHYGAKCIYYLPTDAEAALFARDRLQTWREESPSIRNVTNQHGTTFRIGSGKILFRGLFAEMRARSIDADMLVLDELDLLSPQRRIQALDRVLHSTMGWSVELSTPKLPGCGIDARFAESDMRFWLVTCPGCGRAEPLEHDFPRCIKVEDGKVHLVCPKCGSDLNPQEGNWVAAKPGSGELRGYQFCQLHSTVVSLGQLWKDWKSIKYPYERERFYNSILGLPYSSDNAILDMATIETCMIEEKTGRLKALWAGVDVGDIMHVVMGCGSGSLVKIFYLGKLSDWDELGRLLTGFGTPVVVIDAMPYKSSAKRLAKGYPPGKMLLSYYGSGARRMGAEEGFITIHVDRTEILDELMERIKRGGITFPAREPESWVAARHLAGLRRVRDEDKLGRLRMIYPRGGEDHYAHALAYLLLAVWCFPEPENSIMPNTLPRKNFS